MSRAGWFVWGMLVILLAATMTAAAWFAPERIGQRPAEGLIRIDGTVTYDGPIPDPVPIPEAVTVRELVEVEPETKGLRDAVIWLEGVPETEDAAGDAPEEKVVVDQRNYAFVPHVVAVEAGREVEFRNSENANHGVTVTSTEPNNRFDIVIPPGGRQSFRFVASKSPVAIHCPIHGSMAAWVYVFDHPYHAVTGKHGAFRLPTVPPGRYTLHVQHADGGMRRLEEIVVRAGEPLHLRFAFHGDDLKAGNRPGKRSAR